MSVTPLKPVPTSAAARQVIAPRAVETDMIVEHILKNRQSDQTIAYAAITALIGRDILANRSFLYGAKRILFRDHGIYLGTVRGVGVRIGTHEEIHDAAVRDIGTGRRAFGRGLRKFEVVDYADLSEEKKRERIGYVSGVNTLRLLTSPPAVRKMAEAGGSEPLPSAKVLELFGK